MNKRTEISMSGDYLRLENLPGPQGFNQSNLPRGGEFDKRIPWWYLTGFSKLVQGGGGGGVVALEIDWDINTQRYRDSIQS